MNRRHFVIDTVLLAASMLLVSYSILGESFAAPALVLALVVFVGDVTWRRISKVRIPSGFTGVLPLVFVVGYALICIELHKAGVIDVAGLKIAAVGYFVGSSVVERFLVWNKQAEP